MPGFTVWSIVLGRHVLGLGFLVGYRIMYVGHWTSKEVFTFYVLGWYTLD